jgi:signal transduction histidine kinase
MTVCGDEVLIRFALQNLLQNAVKFSAGKGEISVRQIDDDVIVVADHGIGFDMAYASTLFEPFHRLVRESEFPGTGIGLANVKRIIDRHHGQIWADSKPGEGASFYFWLPKADVVT